MARAAKAKREKLEGRGVKRKKFVAGATNGQTNCMSAQIVPNTRRETLVPFTMEHTEPAAKIYTGDVLDNQESARHSHQEFIPAGVYTNRVEMYVLRGEGDCLLLPAHRYRRIADALTGVHTRLTEKRG